MACFQWPATRCQRYAFPRSLEWDLVISSGADTVVPDIDHWGKARRKFVCRSLIGVWVSLPEIRERPQFPVKKAQITELLDQMNAGDACASDTLMLLIYQELRQMAALRMNSEKAGHTLSPTGLVHEVWLKLVISESRPRWTDRESFFAAAGEAMRRILIDAARRKMAAKRGGEFLRIHETSEAGLDDQSARLVEILDVNHALEKLKSADQNSAAVVNLHYSSGFSLDETADLLNIGRATCYRKWSFARAYLNAIVDDESAFS